MATTLSEDDVRYVLGDLPVKLTVPQTIDLGRRLEVLIARFFRARGAQMSPDLNDNEVALRKFARRLGGALQQADPSAYARTFSSWPRVPFFDSVLSHGLRRHLEAVPESRRRFGLLGLSEDPSGAAVVGALIEHLSSLVQIAGEALDTVKASRLHKPADNRTSAARTQVRPHIRQRFPDFDDLVYGVGEVFHDLTGRWPSFSDNPPLHDRSRKLHSPFGTLMLRLIELIRRDLHESWYEDDKGSKPLARPTMDSIRGAWDRARERRRT